MATLPPMGTAGPRIRSARPDYDSGEWSWTGPETFDRNGTTYSRIGQGAGADFESSYLPRLGQYANELIYDPEFGYGVPQWLAQSGQIAPPERGWWDNPWHPVGLASIGLGGVIGGAMGAFGAGAEGAAGAGAGAGAEAGAGAGMGYGAFDAYGATAGAPSAAAAGGAGVTYAGAGGAGSGGTAMGASGGSYPMLAEGGATLSDAAPAYAGTMGGGTTPSYTSGLMEPLSGGVTTADALGWTLQNALGGGGGGGFMSGAGGALTTAALAALLSKDPPSPPPSPDFADIARQQGQANIETARMQGQIANPNVIGPYGNQNVVWDPVTGQPTVTQTLSPESQRIFDAQQRARMGMADVSAQGINRVSDVLGQPFQYQGPKMPVNAGMTAQQAIMSRLQPQIERERSQQETQLRNQGLVPGGEAYGNAMTIQNQRENDLLNQAALYGVNADLAANQQGWGQEIYQRNMPLNEMTALMSGSQIQNPQFQGYQGATVAPPNVAGAAQQQAQYNQGLYNVGVGQTNAFNQGLFGLGSAALGSNWGRW